MNAPVKPELNEVQRIERALHELLVIAVSPTVRFPHPLGEIFSIGQLSAHFRGMTPVQSKVDALLESPVGEAVRLAIKTLGKRLFEIGGLELMRDVCDRVADLEPSKWGHRTDIMDKRWNGVGSDEGGRWWS